ncbi:MAG: PaaI family thioesterase [Propionibacteriales bacterium]|nr:PaaI family thioesterase [Propionibacteriales bacterium]
MITTSLQDRYFPDLPCFGCGPANAEGLRLKSYLVDGQVTAEFLPWPQHDNGLGFLNGGIIATVLDCHSAALVTHEAYTQGWPALPGTDLPYVTAGLDVRYLRPSPLTEPVRLLGRVIESTEPQITAEVWLEHGGKERARASATWKRWRPR